MATPVSSRKTRRVERRGGRCPLRAGGRDVGAIVVRTRVPFFFTGKAQLFHGPPDRRQTGRRAQGHLQFREGTVRLLADQRRERVQLGREHRMPPVALPGAGRLRRSPAVVV